MPGCPFGQAARAKEIPVVVQKFLLAWARYVGQFEFEFLGGAGNLAAFNDVLFAEARGLYHLVARAVFFVQKARGEINGGVIDDPGFLVGEKVFVTVRREEAAGLWRLKGRKGRKGHRRATRSLGRSGL